MPALYTFCFVLLMMGTCAWGDPGSFSIAAVADPQYADAPPRGNRQPGQGVVRLQHAVTNWNQRELDWGIILGDLIDWDDIDYGVFPQNTVTQLPQDWSNTRAILEAWRQLEIPTYIVLGNHDYYVPFADTDGLKKPASVYRAFGFKDKAYYDFHHKGFRFVVLEGDTGYLNFDPSLPEYEAALDDYNSLTNSAKQWWNAGISVKQRIWLMDRLDESLARNEPVVLACHYPIHPPVDGHSLLNSAEMLEILDGYPNVVLWLNGHNHSGGYALEGRRHHLTLKGMQNNAGNWYQIDFSSDRIKAYQAEDTSTPVHDLDITRPQPSVPDPEQFLITRREGFAELSWAAEPEGLSGVVIERRHIPSAEPWKTLSVVNAPSSRRFHDVLEKPMEEYAYRIRFDDDADGSRHSPVRIPGKK